ncbi:hypothetical protein Tco_0530297 [Tanacetum coccineum]
MIWIRIMGQVHANQGLTADLLGPDVTEENFAERMVKVIAERRRQFETQRFIEKRNKPMTYAQQKNFMRTYVKNQSSVIYSTGWTLKHVKSFTDAHFSGGFYKIRLAVENLCKLNTKEVLIKRPGADLDSLFYFPQKSKSKVTPVSPPKPSDAAPFAAASYTEVSPAVPRTTGWEWKFSAHEDASSEVDLNAPDKSFLHVLSDDDSDDSAGDTNPHYWHAFAAWEIVPTGLGAVNALYFTDKSTKFFTHLREILHLLDRQDLSKLYGMVVKHYEVNPLAGNGLLLWGDLHVLFDSTPGGSSVGVWNDQQEWVIYRWKLFPFSGVHVLETFAGKILYMFADTPYPLSASLMKKMLKHKLEVEIDGIGNDMTHAVQLIQFIKNQLASCLSSA